MAIVYEIEITSHWVNYHPKDLKKLLEKALYSEDMNEVQVEVKEKIIKKNPPYNNKDGTINKKYVWWD